ncbi:MAG: peptidase [Rhodobacteraceae bacterium]|nr:MAG: peptidase [Paracoccaceae bacterium]
MTSVSGEGDAPAPAAPGFAVFDGHNDLLMKLWLAGDRDGRAFFDGADGHVDLAKCRAGGFAGGFFAIWPPDPAEPPEDDPEPTWPPLDVAHAGRAAMGMAAILLRMTRARPDALRLCRSADEIEAARAAGAVAAVMHMEGCEAIDADLDALHVYHAAGLRSLGPVWSRDNIFGSGVPFRHDASPEIGPGLTDAGRRLVRACDRLGVLVDLSHLNAAGFRDVAAITEGPLVATHSNVHALCPASRNLTDWQLSAIAERGGLVGLNFAVQFLRADGAKDAATPLDVLTRHLARLVERLGEGGVALGSDFDGAVMPQAIGDAAGLPALTRAMRAAGFDDALIRRICWDNWVDLLRRVIG